MLISVLVLAVIEVTLRFGVKNVRLSLSLKI